MNTTLFDISVGSYLQSTKGVAQFMQKGLDHAEANGLDLDEIVATRLRDDMLPFRFQIQSVANHTVGAIDGIMTGKFSPPKSSDPMNYNELQQLVETTRQQLKDIDADALNAKAGETVVFSMTNLEMPFTAEDWVLSFSLPNLYFHAATAYDILRMLGVPLAKRDFLGPLRIQR